MFRQMGQGTSLESGHHTARTDKQSPWETFAGLFGIEEKSRAGSKGRMVNFKVDLLLVMAIITLLIFGLLMVYSASYDYSLSWYGNRTTIIMRQFAWLGIGAALLVAMTFIDYHLLRRVVLIAMVGTILMLVGVLFLSDVRNGAIRTLYEGSIQPSELAKFMTVLYLAVWLHAKREKLGEMSFGLFPLAVILGVLSGLILVQPDFSAVITILMLGGLMFFLAGGDLRQIGVMLLVALLIGYGVVMLTDTGALRVQDYMAGLRDPTQGSYHVRRSFGAIVNGGWFGVGIGNSEGKLTGLPVPPTDSIFAVVGEETGFVGAALLVGLYGVLLWRGFTIARRAPDQLGALLASGLTMWIAIEAFINMAVMVNLLPFAGNALPFISAGGSSLVISLFAVGILLNISRLSGANQMENGRSNHAVVNLRGRDRRRRVSSVKRASSVGRSQRKTSRTG